MSAIGNTRASRPRASQGAPLWQRSALIALTGSGGASVLWLAETLRGMRCPVGGSLEAAPANRIQATPKGAIIDTSTAIVILFVYAISLLILYAVIKTAIRHALLSHYKAIRWYEKTGSWQPGPHGTGTPLDFPAEEAAQVAR